jgi:hypothetical protein
LGGAVDISDSLSTRITDIAMALTTYASILSSVKTGAECIRSDATAGDLVMSGTVVQEPKDSSDTKKIALYSSLSGRMFAANLTLATGRQDIRESLASSDVDRMKDGCQIFNIVANFARSGAPAIWTVYSRNFFSKEGARLIDMVGDILSGIISTPPSGVLNSTNARAANKSINYARELEMKGNSMLSKSKN